MPETVYFWHECLSSFLFYYFLLTHCRFRGLLLHLITLNHTHTHKLSRTPLDEESARRTDLYLTKHNTQKTQTSIPSVGFEPAMNIMDIKYVIFSTFAPFHSVEEVATINVPLSTKYKKINWSHYMSSTP